MSGKATNGRSRAEQRQYPPARCGRCGKRVKDGTGQRADSQLLCARCADRQAGKAAPVGRAETP